MHETNSNLRFPSSMYGSFIDTYVFLHLVIHLQFHKIKSLKIISFMSPGVLKTTAISGAGRGGGNAGNFPPPPKLKKIVVKMVLFPKALFLAKTFPK